MLANVSLEAAGQWGQAPATPCSYSNNDINLDCFSFFFLCQDTHSRYQASSVLRQKIHSFGECCIHNSCRFTMCFTPCRVYLHQDASNPRKKKLCYKITPTACSESWVGRKPPKRSREVNSSHTPQFSFACLLIQCTHFNKHAHSMSTPYSYKSASNFL